MNSRLYKENLLLIAKKIAAVAGLVALTMFCAGSSRAQSKPRETETTAARSGAVASEAAPGVQPSSAITPAQHALVKATPAVARNSSGKPSAPEGQREGITVHGHWAIEVRNPDGKLVSHTEFENALSPGFPFPILEGLTAQVPGGAAFLSALMSGQAVITPGNWAILLEGSSLALPSPGAPCVTAQTYGTCFIFSSATVPNFNPTDPVPICTSGVPAGQGLSCNLTVSPLGTGQNFTGFQLSGSVAATQPGTVSAVATMNFGACGPTNALPNCAFFVSSVNDGLAALTARNLDGNTPIGAAAGDPNPVPVIAGQTISVTVTISFQ